jgi:hypothetical protein
MGPDVLRTVFPYRSTKKGFGLARLEAVMECDGGDGEAAMVRVHRIGCEADQLTDIFRKTGHMSAPQAASMLDLRLISVRCPAARNKTMINSMRTRQ